MPAPIDAMDLPRSSAPTLQLLQATESEMIETSTLGSVSWKGPVDTKDYLRREAHLRDQALTRHGGITYWVLVDPTAAPTSAGSRRILASCETIRKRALIARPGKEVKEVISHGIGSVHCNPAYRGRGFAQRMMTELTRNLHTWQQKEGESVDFTVLWSDIGKVCDAPAIPCRPPALTLSRTFMPGLAGTHTLRHTWRYLRGRMMTGTPVFPEPCCSLPKT